MLYAHKSSQQPQFLGFKIGFLIKLLKSSDSWIGTDNEWIFGHF